MRQARLNAPADHDFACCQTNNQSVPTSEMGHNLNLPVLVKTNDNHDGPPWPDEFTSDGIPYSNQKGLMKGGFSNIGGFQTNWMRHQDWRKANDTAKSKYEQ